MDSCCGDAQIISYDDDCGIYCVVLNQTIDDLTICLMDEGAQDAPEDVFCSGNTTESKTKDGEVPATAKASVIVKEDNGLGCKNKECEKHATTTSITTATSESSNGAARGEALSSIGTCALILGVTMLLHFTNQIK